MSVQELERFLPQSDNPMEAFSVVRGTNPGIVGLNAQELRQFPNIDMVANTAVHFFSAALGFLANRTKNPLLQKLGAAAWYATYDEVAIQIRLTKDMIAEPIERGIPAEAALEIFVGHDQPHLFYVSSASDDQISGGRSLILFPPEFLTRCQEVPVKGLSESSFIASFIVSAYAGGIDLDPNRWVKTGHVVQAYLLNEIQILHPEIPLDNDDLQILDQYSPDNLHL